MLYGVKLPAREQLNCFKVIALEADIVLNNVSRLSREELADRPQERPLFIACNLSDGYPTAVIME